MKMGIPRGLKIYRVAPFALALSLASGIVLTDRARAAGAQGAKVSADLLKKVRGGTARRVDVIGSRRRVGASLDQGVAGNRERSNASSNLHRASSPPASREAFSGRAE